MLRAPGRRRYDRTAPWTSAAKEATLDATNRCLHGNASVTRLEGYEGRDAVEGRPGRKGVCVRLVLLTVLVLLACVTSSASSRSAPPISTCTSGASSVTYGEEPVTAWYPEGCVHP